MKQAAPPANPLDLDYRIRYLQDIASNLEKFCVRLDVPPVPDELPVEWVLTYRIVAVQLWSAKSFDEDCHQRNFTADMRTGLERIMNSWIASLLVPQSCRWTALRAAIRGSRPVRWWGDEYANPVEVMLGAVRLALDGHHDAALGVREQMPCVRPVINEAAGDLCIAALSPPGSAVRHILQGSVPAEPAPAVILGQSHKEPVSVCGVSTQLSHVQWKVVDELLKANPDGLSIDELKDVAASGRNLMYKWAKDEIWKSVVRLPGVKGNHYRIVQNPDAP